MTSLHEIRAWTIEEARRVKEAVCAKRPTDIKAMIDVYRGDELVAKLVPYKHERDSIMQAFRAAAGGFDADAMALTFEAYTTFGALLGTKLEDLQDDPEAIADLVRRQNNPLTGKPWGPGEMADVALNHGGLDKGWVFETVSISCANRAGDINMAMLPYRYSGKYLVWLEPDVSPEGMDAEGLMPDAMIAAMNEVSFGTVFPYPPGDFSRAQRDVMAAQILMQKLPCQVGLLAEVTQRDRLRVLRQAGIMLS